MDWVVKENNDIKPEMTAEQIRIFREQHPNEFNRVYKEI